MAVEPGGVRVRPSETEPGGSDRETGIHDHPALIRFKG